MRFLIQNGLYKKVKKNLAFKALHAYICVRTFERMYNIYIISANFQQQQSQSESNNNSQNNLASCSSGRIR